MVVIDKLLGRTGQRRGQDELIAGFAQHVFDGRAELISSLGDLDVRVLNV